MTLVTGQVYAGCRVDSFSAGNLAVRVLNPTGGYSAPYPLPLQQVHYVTFGETGVQGRLGDLKLLSGSSFSGIRVMSLQMSPQGGHVFNVVEKGALSQEVPTELIERLYLSAAALATPAPNPAQARPVITPFRVTPGPMVASAGTTSDTAPGLPGLLVPGLAPAPPGEPAPLAPGAPPGAPPEMAPGVPSQPTPAPEVARTPEPPSSEEERSHSERTGSRRSSDDESDSQDSFSGLPSGGAFGGFGMFLGLTIGALLGVILVFFLLNIVFNSVIIWIVAKFFVHVEELRFKQCFFCALYLALLPIICLPLLVGLAWIGLWWIGTLAYIFCVVAGARAIVMGSLEVLEGPAWTVIFGFIVGNWLIKQLVALFLTAK